MIALLFPVTILAVIVVYAALAAHGRQVNLADLLPARPRRAPVTVHNRLRAWWRRRLRTGPNRGDDDRRR